MITTDRSRTVSPYLDGAGEYITVKDKGPKEKSPKSTPGNRRKKKAVEERRESQSGPNFLISAASEMNNSLPNQAAIRAMRVRFKEAADGCRAKELFAQKRAIFMDCIRYIVLVTTSQVTELFGKRRHIYAKEKVEVARLAATDKSSGNVLA